MKRWYIQTDNTSLEDGYMIGIKMTLKFILRTYKTAWKEWGFMAFLEYPKDPRIMPKFRTHKLYGYD